MKLSEAYEAYKQEPTTFACCAKCRLAWSDDMPWIGSLHCPRCGDALLRGALDPKKYGCRLDLSEQALADLKGGIVEYLRQGLDDPGKQAKNIATPRRSR